KLACTVVDVAVFTGVCIRDDTDVVTHELREYGVILQTLPAPNTRDAVDSYRVVRVRQGGKGWLRALDDEHELRFIGDRAQHRQRRRGSTPLVVLGRTDVLHWPT